MNPEDCLTHVRSNETSYTWRMKMSAKSFGLINSLWIAALFLIMIGCESADQVDPVPDEPVDQPAFPDFITPTEVYFDLRIAGDHAIDSNYYHLKISGGVDHPANLSLEELRNLEMVEQTLTVECIGNPANGNLLGTVSWKGFRLYDLLDSLGIKEGVTFVKYLCSDGYFTYNTLEQLKNSELLGALYMNGQTIPPKYGFPLRIIFPGYYGVRQPGWVVEIELLDSGIMDFWGESQSEKWDTDSAMAIDSKIFFPGKNQTLMLGETTTVGGAAFGSRRISGVEITVDDGATWIPATLKQQMDHDYVWVFWEADFTPLSAGPLTIRAKATGQDGRTQPRDDKNYLDGTNAWPKVTVVVTDGS